MAKQRPPPPRPPATASLLSTSAQGASFLILLQICSRLLTFAVNQVLLRFLSPALLGISTQLELFQVSVLYFSRESLRGALQRGGEQEVEEEGAGPASKDGAARRHHDGIPDASPAGRAQTVVNLSYLAVLLGPPVALLLGRLYLRSLASQPEVLTTPYFDTALLLYGLAAQVELAVEPCFVVAQHRLLYKVRAGAESAATVARCLVTCGVAIAAARRGEDVGVLPFAVGQMAYAVAMAATYLWHISSIARDGGFSLLCRRISSSVPAMYLLSRFSRPLLYLAASLFVQSSIKHLLTQGDTLLMTALSTPADQGVYALAANYGSLAARLLFAPVEETTRALFSSLLASSSPSKSAIATATSALNTILHLYSLLALVVFALAPTLAPLLLSLVAGPRWSASGAGPALAAYTYYIPLLAVNGVLEAFVASVATPAELRSQSAALLFFSAGFAAAGVVFLRVLAWGARGLVAANAASMVLRVLWSARFIATYLRRNHGAGLSMVAVRPSAGSVAAAVAAAAVLTAVHPTSAGGLRDLLKGGAVAGACGLVIILAERDFLRASYALLRPGSVADDTAPAQLGAAHGADEKRRAA